MTKALLKLVLCTERLGYAVAELQKARNPSRKPRRLAITAPLLDALNGNIQQQSVDFQGPARSYVYDITTLTFGSLTWSSPNASIKALLEVLLHAKIIRDHTCESTKIAKQKSW
ncbi:hypothetical protein F442_22091 [Phytophthora nicotianae P10297]|uniref:Uncharacterized protein n=1 Tax=Phytophthora nicotianae P10297 TaxID=1317064 RepID=W2Y374_PHYNI|nr:hypothetical protein F442_22091 [Phytophthora nicotianae P10297]